MNYLIDFYQELLTPKQRNYMSLYYLDDFSLGEIADEFEVSRQAVYDHIKRTEAMLEQYEERLSLFKKHERRKQLLDHLNTPKMTQSSQTTWELLQQGRTVEDVAVRRRLTNSTMEDHLVEIAMDAPTFPLALFVDTAQHEEIRHIAQQLKTYALKRIKSAMLSDVSYFQIRLVLASSKWEGS
jgi:predicted DNA-binding protein YlxM (UPF0122 family)